MTSREDIVSKIREWVRLPVEGTAAPLMEQAAKEIVALRAMLAHRWMVDRDRDNEPKQNHRRPDQH